ncbi:MAG: 2-hydroxyglutaryl-CoA dehydratase [Deferribacteres bacterium]|nr:2-hydroxyglutaryl-CoA dehydratase [Deferribacteres bacterium]
MDTLKRIKYEVITKAAKLALKGNRILSERKFKTPKRWRTDILAPPLKIGLRTKELVTRHYLEGRYAEGAKPVAWVTSGAPVEILKALGFYVLYPENHAALCGARRTALELCLEAEKSGYSMDICSYARCDFGALISGKTPVGKLPKPDLLLCCTNICQTVLYWYRVLEKHFNVPLVVIDTPFLYREAEEHHIEYVKNQLDKLVEVAERVSGKKLKFERLKETLRLSKMAAELWHEVIQTGKNVPSPISVFDQFIHMAPIVEMRGDAETVDFYAEMLKELQERIEKGVSAVVKERRRLLWDNLPIWYKLKFLSEFLAERGIAIVTSTYTNAWGELAPMMDPQRPIESMAKTYLYPILNRGVGHKLKTMKEMIKDYSLNGAILHSDRSCKPYSVGQIDERNRLISELGVPALLLEADHNDPRAYAEEQVRTRLSAFAEMLES